MNGIDISFYESGLRNVLRNSNKNNKNFNIEINHNKNINNSNIIDFQIGPHMENRKNYHDNYCILFSINIYKKKLYKIFLEKCSLLSGTKILVILEKIAKIFKLSTISLQDASTITIISLTNKEYILSLGNIYILSVGISWYNKFGYVSENFREEKEYNEIIMKIPLLDYMNVILEKNINEFNTRFNDYFIFIKKKYFSNNSKIHNRIIKIKNIIKKKYGINNPNIITDDILYEATKILREYDENIEKINSKHHKFMTYLESSNLLNYIKSASTISDVIKSFREKIKRRNIRLDDNELEFIKYILDSSHNILEYNNNLVKIIE